MSVTFLLSSPVELNYASAAAGRNGRDKPREPAPHNRGALADSDTLQGICGKEQEGHRALDDPESDPAPTPPVGSGAPAGLDHRALRHRFAGDLGNRPSRRRGVGELPDSGAHNRHRPIPRGQRDTVIQGFYIGPGQS